MTIFRLIYGIIYGFSIPLTTSMISEITPLKFRGKSLVLINFFVSIGKLYGCLLAYIFLENFTKGNWRLMMITSGISSLLVFLGSIFILKESARFLIANKNFR